MIRGKEQRIKGSWWFRVRFKKDGAAQTKERSGFKSKTKAREAMDAEIKKLQNSRGRSVESNRKDFSWLVARCKENFLKPAEYRESKTHGRIKVSGLKSYDRTLKSQLERLTPFFGDILLEDIESETLDAYKTKRLRDFVTKKDGTKLRPVSLATVHRELALARRIILHGYNEGWIEHNPFRRAKGRNLIRLRDEEVRERTLSCEEQTRLLKNCSGEFEKEYTRTRNGVTRKETRKTVVDHVLLRTLITVAIESGFRLNELRHVRWQDIDAANNSIWILPGFTKTGIGRRSLLTTEAMEAIDSIQPLTAKLAGPFVGVGDIKKAWASTKERAGITDLHFHDLRATFASRTAAAGVPLTIIQKLMGHSTGTVTQRHYIAIPDDVFADTIESVRAYKRRRKTDN